MGLIRNLLGKTVYPDNYWTRDKENGDPLEPYDLATHTMNEFMGVRVDPVDETMEGDFEILPRPNSGRRGRSTATESPMLWTAV